MSVLLLPLRRRPTTAHPQRATITIRGDRTTFDAPADAVAALRARGELAAAARRYLQEFPAPAAAPSSTVLYADDQLTLHHGSALDVAAELEPRSVQAIITSPPYWALRDYDEPDQLGSEPTVEEYVANLVAVFAALRDTLADDGTVWLNLGDTYAAKARGNDVGWDKSRLSNPGGAQKRQAASLRRTGERHRGQASGIAAKNLIGVPWRVALALQADGWVLRSDIIWAKPNHMPESVSDRPTNSHEHLFLLAKRPRYYYDAAAIREPDKGRDVRRTVLSGQPALDPSGGRTAPHRGLRTPEGRNGLGRNKRDVWTIPTVPFTGAHFAAYPPALIRPAILAGTRPGDTVLDPFSGSGTTGMVATQEGRRYVGIDVSKTYLDLSLATRFANPTLNLAALAEGNES